jgi:hypothetical protein
MVSAKAAEKGSHEAKLLEHVTTAVQTPEVWGQPVRMFKTKLTRAHQYADASQWLDNKKLLRLAVDFPAIHRQYQDLMKEIEERIHESLGAARVPS